MCVSCAIPTSDLIFYSTSLLGFVQAGYQWARQRLLKPSGQGEGPFRCSVCRSDLFLTDTPEVLPTYVDEVLDQEPTLQQVYQCTNFRCASHRYHLRWLHGGECHGDLWIIKERKKFFLDGIDASLGSFQRKLQVEHPIFQEDTMRVTLGRFLFTLEPRRIADYDGNTRWKWWRLRVWYQRDPSFGAHSLIHWWATTLYHLLSYFYYTRGKYQQTGHPALLKEIFPTWPHLSARRRFLYRVLAILHPALYQAAQQQKQTR
jgi:hypothetical protein